MTEIPEHLLARSKSRRSALGLGGGDAGDAPPPSAAPAPAEGTADDKTVPARAAKPAATAPAKVEAQAPEPLPPYIEAALKRKRIPFWAAGVLAFLPVWALLYAQTLSAPPTKEKTQLQAGADVYSAKGCSGCHGGSGGGGAGRKFADCEVVKTFPYIEDQLAFVRSGSKKDTPYGDAKRAGGQRPGGYNGALMPSFAESAMTDKELLEVVRHERETLGGEAVPAKQIDATGARLWPDGKPMLSSAGKLIGPDGKELLDAKGALTEKDPSKTAGGEKGKCA